MYRNDEVIRRYSEPFKLKILAELTTENTQRANFINPTLLHLKRSINEWIKKHHRKEVINTSVKLETKDEFI